MQPKNKPFESNFKQIKQRLKKNNMYQYHYTFQNHASYKAVLGDKILNKHVFFNLMDNIAALCSFLYIIL